VPDTVLSRLWQLAKLKSKTINANAQSDLQFRERQLKENLTMAGYSGTPLPQKLGIKAGMRVIAMGVPENYRKLLGKLPDGVEFSNKPNVGAQFIHFFVTRRSDLEKHSPMMEHFGFRGPKNQRVLRAT
jgi:hypothetical protein